MPQPFRDTAPQHRIPPDLLDGDPAQTEMDLARDLWAECDAMADRLCAAIMQTDRYRRLWHRAAPDCADLHRLLSAALIAAGRL